ncbi:MAG: GAF domain-containing protein [Nitrospirae bacterium]|nr:GAF domain-containing protein [Nitrospirota bacterium]
MAQGKTAEDKKTQNLNLLSRVGIALSSEKDTDKLLEMIVDAARSMSNADAGTLYILNKKEKHLSFEILQNDTMKTRISSKHKEVAAPPPVPLYIEGQQNNSNVSSFVALTGKTISIADVYESTEFNFAGPKNYDAKTGYRTKSMLVIPMTNHENEIIGVLQLINAKDFVTGDVIPFSEDDKNYVSSLASQAAIAMTNSALIKDLIKDIEEIKSLQRSEKELGAKLRDAYIKTEEANKELKAALKKVQMIRVAATVFILLLFIAVGVYSWNRSLLPERKKAAAATTEQKGAASQTHKIVTGTVTSSLYLTGTLEPLNVVNITSPIYGKVKEIFFRYGEIVNAGQVLLRMDTSEVEVKHREAKAVYIRAAERYKEIEKWEDSQEVVRVKRSLSKSKLALDLQKQTYEDTERLFKKGLVSASELAYAKQQYTSVQLDYQSAADELKAAIEKGTGENKNIAHYEMENAKTRLKDLEDQLTYSTVTAPVSGVIMLPGSVFEAGEAKKIEKGSHLQEGGIIMSIGNLTGFSVKAKVDEVDITKVDVGQSVVVTGDAFPGISLEGTIANLSSQGNIVQGGGVPTFEMKVVIENIEQEYKSRIFVGMSANLEILTYLNDKAITVPITAVTEADGKQFVKKQKLVKGKKSFEKTEVQTGRTHYNSIEILSGLAEGDEVLTDGR